MDFHKNIGGYERLLFIAENRHCFVSGGTVKLGTAAAPYPPVPVGFWHEETVSNSK